MSFLPLLFAVVPLSIASLGAGMKSVAVMSLTVPILFVMVGLLPFCHRRENLWMFAFSAISVIPINIYILQSIDLSHYFDDSLIKTCLWSVLLFFILLAIEEISLGLVTRFVWKRQYKLPDFNDD